jgi:hypothetical protein
LLTFQRNNVAGYEAIDRLIHPRAIDQLLTVAAAGVIGFIGNEAEAIFRIRMGRAMLLAQRTLAFAE